MIINHTTFMCEAKMGQRTENHYLLLRRNNIRGKHHVDAKLKDLPWYLTLRFSNRMKNKELFFF